jgi:predicted transcriptional regulator
MSHKSSPSNDAPRPTDAELVILRVLWDRGPSTVREVHEALDAEKGVGYTTTLKLLQKMAAKGLVGRDESQRSHVYQARCQEEPTQRRLVSELLTKAFAGSTPTLVMQALSAKQASKEDLAEIRRLLDEMEKGGGG